MIKGSHPTDEQRAKQSAAQMGHIVSTETRAKMSAAQMGRKVSPETRAKISAGEMGNKKALGHSHPQSPESRAKMSVARMGNTNGHGSWRGGEKIANARFRARRRILGFVPLNEPFVGGEGHHVDRELVIFMPKALHRSIYHRQSDGRGMAQINAIAYNFLFKQEVEAAFEAFDVNVKAA
jgi:hypothetical protein